MPLSVTVIRGSIGVGKSAILHAIRACTQYHRYVHVMLEDTAEWQYYLQKFYKDPHQYAFMFQKDVEMHFFRLTKRLEQLEETAAADGEIVHVFVERSPVDVAEVFLPMNRDVLTEEQFNALAASMEQLSAHPVWASAQSYTIKCTVDEGLERINTRRRSGEERITRAYLEDLQQRYDALATRHDSTIILNHTSDTSLLDAVRTITQTL